MNKWRYISRTIGLWGSCLLCGDKATAQPNLCSGCLVDLPRLGPACPTCAAPLPHATRCRACQQQPPLCSETLIPYRYEMPVTRLIHLMKFEQRLAAANALGVLLAAFIAERAPQRPDAILPVPLHSGRLRRRGFNQALEIARPVANHLRIPIETSAIQRVKATRPQSELKGIGARRRNLRRAFAYCNGSKNWTSIAIVDDVMTTGTTTEELTRTLLEHGVERVSVWACARATT